MFRRTPALADWLLNRLGYTRQNAPLLGDLHEEFRNGRSAAWYWRQAFAVISNGATRNVALLAPYWLALTAGFAVQFSLSYALWSLGFPREVPGSAWTKVGLWLLFQLGGFLAGVAPVKWALGEWTTRLRPMFCAAGSDQQKRSTILALTCYDGFSFGFWSYCLCGVIFPRFAQAEFVTFQSIWFVLWVFTPAVLAARDAPAERDADPAEDREPWRAIPQREPLLTVRLRDGRALPLVRDRLAEAIFEAADPELIQVAFGYGNSLGLLRRVVWLGGYQTRSHIAGRTESLTLAEFAALLKQTARTPQVERALFDTDRRRSLWDRLLCSFRGDPA